MNHRPGPSPLQRRVGTWIGNVALALAVALFAALLATYGPDSLQTFLEWLGLA